MKNIDVTAIILIDENKKILMQKRYKNSKIFPNSWGFFGGKVEINESYEKAIIRETKEELDFYLLNPQLIFIDNYRLEKNQMQGKWVIFKKYVTIKDKKKLKLLDGVDWNWFDLDEILNENITNETKNILVNIKDKL